MFLDSPFYTDLQAWYRERLANGYDPVGGSRILSARFAPVQGHLSAADVQGDEGGTGGRDHPEEKAA